MKAKHYLLGSFPLSLAIMAGCGDSNPDNKVVEQAPPVQPSEVDSKVPEAVIDNPTVAPNSRIGETPTAEMTPAAPEMPAGGTAPAVVDKPVEPTSAPNPQ